MNTKVINLQNLFAHVCLSSSNMFHTVPHKLTLCNTFSLQGSGRPNCMVYLGWRASSDWVEAFIIKLKCVKSRQKCNYPISTQGLLL